MRGLMLTISGALTDDAAGLAGVRVPVPVRDNTDLDAVLAFGVQVFQNHPGLLYQLMFRLQGPTKSSQKQKTR